ncbi:sulfotransferase [bacterium]|nr:sulfotransferase [bacterium]
MGNHIVYRDKLIMVMGMQRSGTTALLYALGQDPSIQVENEEPEGPLYDAYRLRPADIIHGELIRMKRRVILKPVLEAEYREIDDVVQEFLIYDPLVVWIYRDPVDVWSSAKNTFSLSSDDMLDWLKRWVRGNESALRSLSGPFRERIRAVSYNDLIEKRDVYRTLCDFLRLRPVNNLFWRENPKKGHRSLPESIRSLIERKTKWVMKRLEANRLRPLATLPNDSTYINEEETVERSAWTVRTNNGVSAFAFHSPDVSWATRVQVESEETKNGWDIQAFSRPFSVLAYRPYIASCWIRSDSPRDVDMVLGQDHEPWEGLGFAQKFHVTPEWQHIGVRFTPHSDEPFASLRFDLGGDTTAVEISPIKVGSPLFDLNQLSFGEGASGRVTLCPDDASAVRVNIDALSGSDPTDVQLTAGHSFLQAGQYYTLAVRLRAAESRTVRVSVGQTISPWELRGLCQDIDVSREWSTHLLDFRATAGGESRLYFDLGLSAATIDFSFIYMFPSSDRIHQYTAHDGARCELEFPEIESGSVRATVSTSEKKSAEDVQLFISNVRLEAMHRYRITFQARADMTRDFGFGVGRNEEPWDDLGIYHKVIAGRIWQQFYYEFLATEDCDNARVLFDIGQSSTPIEIRDVAIDRMKRSEYENPSVNGSQFAAYG